MKLCIFGIAKELKLEYGTISMLVIKRPELLRKIIYQFIEKNNDSNEVVITDEQRIYLENVVLIENPFKLELDGKKVISIIGREIQEEHSIHYDKEVETRKSLNSVISSIDSFLRRYELDYEYAETLEYSQILKLLGFELNFQNLSFIDKVLAFMGIQSKLFNKKIFVLLNIQSLFTKDEIMCLGVFAKEKNIAIIGIDSASYSQVVMGETLEINEDYSY